MQKIDYKKKYLSTYAWQILSILLGFLSLFIVIPFLSSDKILYGVYSVCTSLTIFFSYADIGFISAGLKYAAEYYSKKEIHEEINIIGFVSFIMLTFFSIVSLGLIYCSMLPNLLLPELIKGSSLFLTARYLLLILALSCPIIICQRILTMIYSIRVEDYKLQRKIIIGNIIKIASVFYFFRAGHYELLEYYTFVQFVNLFVVIIALYDIKKYGYKLSLLIKAIRFNKKLFHKTKKISGTSFLMVICMILYYELDQLFIGRYIGLDAVSIYAIVLSVLALIRTFIGFLYAPYSSRYNHFVGVEDYKGLNYFVNNVVLYLSPIVCSSILILALLSSPFVYSWVGESYKESALLISIISLSFIPNFITNPVASYFLARERNQYLIKWNVIMVLIYWGGIMVTVEEFGLFSFAIFKFIAPLICMLGYWRLAYKDFRNSGAYFISITKVLKNISIPIVSCILICNLAIKYMRYSHSNESLCINILIMSLCFIGVMIIVFLTNKAIREYVKSSVKLVYK